MDISILIPIFNEEAILAPSVEKLRDYLAKTAIQGEILLLDNGSTDRTPAIGQELASKYPPGNKLPVRYFRIDKKGPGLSFQQGVREAKNEYLVTLDADLSSDLAFIQHAALLLPQVDAVIGAKTFGRQRRTFLRVLGSQTFILCSQFLFDIPVADFSMGTKGFRRSKILPVVGYLDHWTGYILELVLYHSVHNLKAIQVSVDCNDTRQSRFNLIHEARYRFRHLWRMRTLLNDSTSWVRTIPPQ